VLKQLGFLVRAPGDERAPHLAEVGRGGWGLAGSPGGCYDRLSCFIRMSIRLSISSQLLSRLKISQKFSLARSLQTVQLVLTSNG